MAHTLLKKISQLSIGTHFVRYKHTKHWDPKWKKLRREKVIDMREVLQNYEKHGEMDESVRIKRMKEMGIYPQRPWQEKPIYISSTSNVFEPYVPPEGDGKFSILSTEGAKQKSEFLYKKSKSYNAVRKIRKYEEEFHVGEFAEQATDLYIKAHEALVTKDEQEITRYVTETLYPDMVFNIENKVIRWKFIKSLEPAKVVHARCTSMITDNNMFAQVTVRFHTQQMLAVYDRFGRLMHGSEILAKDVLEYIVFEKHLSNQYGLWRLHSKITPTWMPPPQAVTKTYVIE